MPEQSCSRTVGQLDWPPADPQLRRKIPLRAAVTHRPRKSSQSIPSPATPDSHFFCCSPRTTVNIARARSVVPQPISPDQSNLASIPQLLLLLLYRRRRRRRRRRHGSSAPSEHASPGEADGARKDVAVCVLLLMTFFSRRGLNTKPTELPLTMYPSAPSCLVCRVCLSVLIRLLVSSSRHRPPCFSGPEICRFSSSSNPPGAGPRRRSPRSTTDRASRRSPNLLPKLSCNTS